MPPPRRPSGPKGPARPKRPARPARPADAKAGTDGPRQPKRAARPARPADGKAGTEGPRQPKRAARAARFAETRARDERPGEPKRPPRARAAETKTERPARPPRASAAPSQGERSARPQRTPRAARGTPAAAPAAPRAAQAERMLSGEPQRIAKLLARAGIASRREIERMIEDGRVAIAGKTVETPATILTSLHGVTVDGNPVAAPEPTRLFRFHKPAGFLTAERDPAGRPTIYDRLPRGLPRVMPVGRLDMNTEGLLLLTTDGGLKRQLELPATGVERTYRARTFGDISQETLETLIEGIEIEGIRYGPIDANLERRTGRNQWIELKLREGKNREVRRVLEHLGLQVSRLIRTAYGPFHLGDLPPGLVDEIRQHELVEFRKGLKEPKKSSPGFPGEGDRSKSGGGAAPKARGTS